MEFQESYKTSLKEEVQRLAQVANEARSKGLDPTREVEMRPADDVAGRVEGLVGPVGVADRIRHLSDTEPSHSIAFTVAREIIQGAQTDGWDLEKAAEQAIRTALAIITEGITAGPIEGIASVKIKTNIDGSRYLAVYFAGPIRAAGGTEGAQILLVADSVRQQLDLDRYKPSIENIERYVEEVDLYNRVSHLQFPSKPEEVRLVAKNVPVEVTGEPTAEVEVTGYRDLPGVETNRLRGGAILVLNDSVLGKAHKLANLVESLSLPGWDWLETLAPSESDENMIEQRIQPKEKYLEDIIAGRPVLAYPSRKGGFRVRYGRSRNTGLAALGVHPATMVILDNFIACGTQLITERPGKGCVAMPVDTIHGPIVKLHNGSIVRVDTVEDAKRIHDATAKVLFLGDLLVGFGEFRENNHLIVPAGYCPEWWAQEALGGFVSASNAQREKLLKIIDKTSFSRVLYDPLQSYPDPWHALTISFLLKVPLHPRYLYFWEDLSFNQLQILQKWVQHLTPEYDESRVTGLHGSLDSEIEEILDSLCIPCQISNNSVRFDEAAPILHELFLGKNQCKFSSETDTAIDGLSYIQANWAIPLRSKGTFYIGARIGRPEKAKRREMSPPPNGIFPVGNAGGPMRDLRKAEKKNLVTVEVNYRQCPRCEDKTFLRIEQMHWCPTCAQAVKTETCPTCQNLANSYGPIELSIKTQLNRTRKQFGGRLPGRIKGVKGLMSKNKVPELLEKAILRARHDLFVYKDGTIRFDMTDAPLTHFKPCEISVSPETLQELGYHFDQDGTPLTSENQILELKTQDIIITFDCAKYLYRISQFIDELLEHVYNLKPYYNLQSPNDLVGHLAVGLAPHTSAGIIGRIIGFTPLRVCYAHPFWHAAKRRNCLDKYEEILIWDVENKSLQRYPLGSVVEEIIRNGGEQRIVDDFGTIAIDNPYSHWRAVSFDPEKLEPIFQPIKQWVKGQNNHWMKMLTRSGRSITMTPDHSVFVWNNISKTLEKIRASQLKEGDRVPIILPKKITPENILSDVNILQELATKLPNTQKFLEFRHATRLRNAAAWMKSKLRQFGYNQYKQQETTPNTGRRKSQTSKPSQRKIALILGKFFREKLPEKPYKNILDYNWYRSIPLSHLEILEKEGVFRWKEIPLSAKIGMARDDKVFSPYITSSKNLFRLLGYYVAEGYIRDEPWCYQVNFSVPNQEIRTHLKQILLEVFGFQPYFKQDNFQLVHSSRIHAYLLAYAWGMGKSALTKRVPNFILNVVEEYRFQFLSALVDGDGSIIPSACRTTLYTANKKLADDYCLLLSTLGVFARISHVKGGRFGKTILERYEELGIPPKDTTGLFHVNIPGKENQIIIEKISLVHKKKIERVKQLIQNGFPKTQRLTKISKKIILDPIKQIEYFTNPNPSYCLEVNPTNENLEAYHNISHSTQVCVGQCDGDEDSVLLALDPMINFSREYLPTTRGGTMDTPLVLSVTISPKEIDDEAHNIDGSGIYPLEFYEQALHFVDP
ncbi:MAG: DNA polymerase II large subunit, partial [Candidatus Hermodarchaeia archaeon]